MATGHFTGEVNKDPHGSWMMKITLKNPGELDGLLSAADYEKFVAEEGGTLKSFDSGHVASWWTGVAIELTSSYI